MCKFENAQTFSGLRRTVIVGLFLFLCACKENEKTGLQNFRDVTGEFGAGYYFSATKADLDKNIFLFVQDYDSTGFISLGNKLIKFKLIKGDYNDQTNDFSEVYAHGEYKIRINVKYMRDDTAYENYVGEMSLENKSGIMQKERVVGYSLSE